MITSDEMKAWGARLPGLCAGLVIALAALTIFGWISGMSVLASFRHAYIPMAPSTAVCFLCVGFGIALNGPHEVLGVRFLCAFVLLVATAKIAEVLGGFHFGIDEKLVADPSEFGAVHTGRMSTITAFNFVVMAIGILLLGIGGMRAWAGPAAALALLISGVVLLGYIYGTPLLYGGGIIPVALPTALAFFVSATGLLARAGSNSWPLHNFVNGSTHALLMRCILPAIVILALLEGWIRTTVHLYAEVNPAVTSAVSAIVFALLVAWIVSQVGRTVGGRIDRAEAERAAAQADLVALNNHLETLVRERTRELEDKNSLMNEELEMARELQLALLPQKFPSIPGNASAGESAVRFVTYYFPTGDVSGDFFSVFPVGEKAIGVFICDVMGHGVRAALVTSMIRALVEEHVHDALEPGALLGRINRGLVAILEQAGAAMYATAFYLVIDTQHGELRYATAGHPRPFHISRHGTNAEPLIIDGISGPALGIFDEAKYGTGRRPLAIGDLIMLFTDGLFEVQGREGDMYSETDLLSSVRNKMPLPPKEFFDEVLGEVRAFSSTKTFDDDVCLIGVEVHNLG